MKRKLITYDVFESIQDKSLSSAEYELREAQPILANTLEIESMDLVCYGPENALFETIDGDYIHVTYELNENFIDFDNIEQLVIDEQSEEDHAKTLVQKMLGALIEGKSAKADEIFADYINLPFVKRTMTTESVNEGLQIKASHSDGHGRRSKFRGKTRAGGKAAARKAALTRKKNARKISPGLKSRIKKIRELETKKLGGRKLQTNKGQRSVRANIRFKTGAEKTKRMQEWAMLSENVAGYVNYREYGKIVNESTVETDERGNVVAVRIPNSATRNEAKILSFNWKTLNTDVKVLRNDAKTFSENLDFCKAVANLKRQNAISDTDKLQECLDDVVTKWSSILYLTQSELANTIAEALEAVAATNYDDQTCDFMAEALLRTVYDVSIDRVSKIVGLSNAKLDENTDDAYAEFRKIADSFYPTLDENSATEMQVFVDLYEALRGVHQYAHNSQNEMLKNEAAAHLRDLAAVIEQKEAPSLDVAVAAAELLNQIIETNLGMEDWTVSNNVHTTVNGDHPRMSQIAKKGYNPDQDFSDDWGDSAPVSDGKSYKNGLADEMRNKSWGNIGGKDTYPSLDNPYVPSPFGDYKIKGEKTIDGDSDQLAHAGGADTWPALQNPYMPGETNVDKMKSDNLIIDK